MSDIMKSIPFGQLMEWILEEHKKTGQIFGIQKAYVADPAKTIEIFGRKLENPAGPAAESACIHAWLRTSVCCRQRLPPRYVRP